MKRIRLLALAVLAVIAGAAPQYPGAVVAQTNQATRRSIELVSQNPSSDQRSTASVIESLISSGDLRLIDQRDDPLVPGRRHSRYQQAHAGLPVLGADLTVQRAGPQIVSAFGVIFEGLSVNTRPAISFVQASATLASRGVTALNTTAPLAIFPAPDGSVHLVYAVQDSEGFVTYLSAANGDELLRVNQIQTQSAVIPGTGAFGDTKKVSSTGQGGTYLARDALRPPALETFDLQGSSARAIAIANGVSGVDSNDLARQTGNSWTDSAVVDAHVHAGFVYDYYYRRFQRRGLDNNDVRIHSMVHPARLQDARTAPPQILGTFYLNAFYSSACRCMVYGEGIPANFLAAFPSGVRNFASALDVVGHELTHAVTDASSRLFYVNESGALNEAFSDIMGTGAEFLHHPSSGSVRADYQIGEDLAPVGTGLMRSMSSPTEFDQPDHYNQRLFIGATSSAFDSGGVHINSGIANNAFYLAIEGGVHRLSRRSVTGVGASNREQIERVFYRAFTAMLPSSSTFYMARTATLQSARDLYGAGSPAERAVTEAWDAVGVVSPAAALTTQFTPRSVPPNAGSCASGGARPSFSFRVAVSEFQGVGFTVSGFNVYSYDNQQRLIGTSRFPSATFQAWFSECQPASTRIGPRGTACVSLCGDLGGRLTGYSIFEFTGSDDNGIPGVFNSDPVSLGLPAINAEEGPVTEPTFRKAGGQ